MVRLPWWVSGDHHHSWSLCCLESYWSYLSGSCILLTVLHQGLSDYPQSKTFSLLGFSYVVQITFLCYKYSSTHLCFDSITSLFQGSQHKSGDWALVWFPSQILHCPVSLFASIRECKCQSSVDYDKVDGLVNLTLPSCTHWHPSWGHLIGPWVFFPFASWKTLPTRIAPFCLEGVTWPTGLP